MTIFLPARLYQILGLFVTCVTVVATCAAAQTVSVDAQGDRAFDAQLGDGAEIRFQFGSATEGSLGVDAEVGFVRDAALYASFGVEAQIFQFSKIVVPLNIRHRSAGDSVLPGGTWHFRSEFAPLYEYIRAEPKEQITYETLEDGTEVDGATHYRDWYKNLGSRIYYLGDAPLIETWLSYETGSHLVKIGRTKGVAGFQDEEVFWGDDGKFAPMQHWLVRDLFTGVSYTHNLEFGRAYNLQSTAAIYSGNNPIKGYGKYLDHVQTPNLKANNTGTFAGHLRLTDRGLLGGTGFVQGTVQAGRKGSTHAEGLSDGKRNASLWTIGAHYSRPLQGGLISGIDGFAQATNYSSGLRAGSAQNDGSGKFKDIHQSGYFVGTTVRTLEDRLAVSAAYEEFDRFDYNVFEYYSFAETTPYDTAKQRSLIFGARYALAPAVSLAVFYHKVDNPIPEASHILESRGSDRLKVTFQIN